MQIITVSNLKGGTGKTTSAAYLAHAFAAGGAHVLVVDADPQQSALKWSDGGQWDIPTISFPKRNLHTQLAGIVAPSTDLVIIDAPPRREGEQTAIMRSALRAADTIVIPMAPTMAEYEELDPMWDEIAEIEPLRARPAEAAVLLNRTVANAKSTDIYRDQITADGHRVLRVTIPRRESIAQAHGLPIDEAGAYAYVAEELAAITGAAA